MNALLLPLLLAPPAALSSDGNEALSVEFRVSAVAAESDGRVPPGGTVAVQLRRTEAPRERDASVELSCDCLGHEITRAFDEDDRVVVTDLPPGEYTVKLQYGWAQAERKVHLKSGREVEATIRLSEDMYGRPKARHEPNDPSAKNMVWSGVGVMTLGATLLAGGVFSLAMNPCGRDGARGTDCSRDTRTVLGATLGATGSVALAGGATLVVLGKRKQRRLELTPGLGAGREGARVSLTGRF